MQEFRHPPHPLPPGTSISKVFEQMGGAMLILGAPGAGKTTLLLDLARDLVAQAEQDESRPIPVVFNLSSWAEQRRPLKEWLVEKLNIKYDVPRKVAQGWVDNNTILLLLDGLDEVAKGYRAACIEGINAYRQEHGLVPLVVCCRVTDYETLTARLRLGGSVLIQPLTPQQIDICLIDAGTQFRALRTALQEDIGLQELAQTPLLLNIMICIFLSVYFPISVR